MPEEWGGMGLGHVGKAAADRRVLRIRDESDEEARK
jgi:hypothetical protein